MAKSRPQKQQMKQKTKSKKNVKKSFFDVYAPITSTKIQLYSSTKEDLIGKLVRLDLTKNLRGKNLELRLRIKTEKEKLIAVPECIELINSYIKRAMRKGIDYCEDSFETACRDSVVRVKPIMITRKRVSRSILNTLRENARKNLESHLKTRNAGEIFSEVISNKLQKQMVSKLKKIYPLALCEIRMFKILKLLEKISEKNKNEKL